MRTPFTNERHKWLQTQQSQTEPELLCEVAEDFMSDDRRSTNRFLSENLALVAEWAPEGEMTAEEFSCPSLKGERLVTLDLSEGGCAIFSPRPIELKKELTFTLCLDELVLAVRGRTVRARRTKHAGKNGWRIGVQFLDIDPMERDGIALFLVESGADPMM